MLTDPYLMKLMAEKGRRGPLVASCSVRSRTSCAVLLRGALSPRNVAPVRTSRSGHMPARWSRR